MFLHASIASRRISSPLRHNTVNIKVSALTYCNRVEKNWKVAMGLLNEQPHKLEEYVMLKFEMKTFEKRFARATSLTEKLELQSQWEKYCGMEPLYEKVRANTLSYFPCGFTLL